MKQSESLDKLMQSLISANQEITNPKNTAENPFFKSKYAPLGDILTSIRPILTKNGLILIQNVSTDETFVSIETGIYHTSGQYILSDKLQMSADKATAQAQGSAITYGRRYQVSAFLNIASEDDDDANSANKKPEDKPKPKPKGVLSKALPVIKGATDLKHLESLEKLINQNSWTEDELKELDIAISAKKGDFK